MAARRKSLALKRQDRFDDDGYCHPLSAEPEAMSTDDGRLTEAMQYKRTMTPAMPWSLARCRCGCTGRASHLGLTDGSCMMSGCELTVRRWVRDGARDPYEGRTQPLTFWSQSDHPLSADVSAIGRQSQANGGWKQTAIASNASETASSKGRASLGQSFSLSLGVAERCSGGRRLASRRASAGRFFATRPGGGK